MIKVPGTKSLVQLRISLALDFLVEMQILVALLFAPKLAQFITPKKNHVIHLTTPMHASLEERIVMVKRISSTNASKQEMKHLRAQPIALKTVAFALNFLITKPFV